MAALSESVASRYTEAERSVRVLFSESAPGVGGSSRAGEAEPTEPLSDSARGVAVSAAFQPASSATHNNTGTNQEGALGGRGGGLGAPAWVSVAMM